jgi:hypothetical protein
MITSCLIWSCGKWYRKWLAHHLALWIETVIRIEPQSTVKKRNSKKTVFFTRPTKYAPILNLLHIIYLKIFNSWWENKLLSLSVKILIGTIWLICLNTNNLKQIITLFIYEEIYFSFKKIIFLFKKLSFYLNWR